MKKTEVLVGAMVPTRNPERDRSCIRNSLRDSDEFFERAYGHGVMSKLVILVEPHDYEYCEWLIDTMDATEQERLQLAVRVE